MPGARHVLRSQSTSLVQKQQAADQISEACFRLRSRHVSAIEQRYKSNALPYNIIYLTHDAKRSQNHHHHDH